MEKNKILFVIYTPYIGFLPKRMAELEMKAKLDGINQVVVTPDNFDSTLRGMRSDTVHLIELHPDTDVSFEEHVRYFEKLEEVKVIIESIKAHNNI